MQIHPQMIILRSRPEEMRTFHETLATESQFKSRALMSSFVVAASTAVSCYGVSLGSAMPPLELLFLIVSTRIALSSRPT